MSVIFVNLIVHLVIYLIFVLFCTIVNLSSTHAIAVTKRCEFHNDTMCQELGNGCNETQECNNDENKRHHCFVLWQNNSMGQPYVKLKVVLHY